MESYLEEISREFNLILIRPNDAFKNIDNYKPYFIPYSLDHTHVDLTHYNDKGYKLFYDYLNEKLKDILKEMK